MSYNDLLASETWRNFRAQILKRDRYRCRRCGDRRQRLHVHHLTYAGGPYCAEVCVTLCEDCHLYVHGRETYDPCNDPYEAWLDERLGKPE